MMPGFGNMLSGGLFRAVQEPVGGWATEWSAGQQPLPRSVGDDTGSTGPGAPVGAVFILDCEGRQVAMADVGRDVDADQVLRRAGWRCTELWHVDPVGRYCAAVEPLHSTVGAPAEYLPGQDSQ